MRVNGEDYRTIWFDEASQRVKAIDQTLLPHRFELITLNSLADVCHAIVHMQVRGAPLIGVTAAFGMMLALREDSSLPAQSLAYDRLLQTRPTAVNLKWALDRVESADEDIASCNAIGDLGLKLLQELLLDTKRRTDVTRPLNILTHCNAGWLATVDWGTALSPIYKAQELAIPIHVWVSETRPRNQGASLTAWELGQQGISHTVVADNACGHLMQQGLVDLCLLGSDRTTSRGDVCNKVGTYLKALAAKDNNVPFYVALPTSSIDWNLMDGLTEIPIEQRDSSEVTCIQGLCEQGDIRSVALTPQNSRALNYAFDVTPARLVSGLITELGIFSADYDSLARARTICRNGGT